MNTSETMVNLAGKSYLLNKNIEQGALLNIITKLQTDLSQMKYLSQGQTTATQIISDTQLSGFNADFNHSLTSGTSSFHSPTNLELKSRLKKNYEEKVQNLIKLYETKISEFQEKVKYLEDDREAFADALEVKHSTITMMKNELQDVVNEKNQELEELKKTHEFEVIKLRNELTVSESCYKDLEQVRKYLEKNNSLMKKEISDTQSNCEKKILSIADEYENEKRKYKTEIRQIRQSIEEVEKQTQGKIIEMERSRESALSDYQYQIERLQEEITNLKQEQKVDEEDKQKLEVERKSFEEKIRHTNMYYEAKVSNLNVSASKDRENFLEEMEAVKGKFEKQFTKLEQEYVTLERDVQMKKKDFLECESLKKQLANEIVDLRAELDLVNRKHAEDYDLLKHNFDSAKKSYEQEHSQLKSILMDKEKIVDDLDIANKKYEKQYCSLKNTIKTMKEEAEQDNEKMWEKLKSEKLFYQEEIKKITEEYGSRLRKQEEEISRSKQENNEYIEKFDQLEISKRSFEKSNREFKVNMDNTFAQLKEDIDRLNREKEEKAAEYEARIEENFTEVAKLQHSVQQYEVTNQILQATNDEYKTVNAENSAKYVAEIGRLRDEVALTKRFHTDDISSIQKQLELKEQIDKEKDERILKLKLQITDIKSSQSTEVDEKINKLEKMRKEFETENSIMKHRLNDLAEDLKIQKDKYETTQERMKMRHEEEKQKLRGEIDQMVVTTENMEKTIVDQERENKLLKKNLEDISKKQSDETSELAENLALTRQKLEGKVHKLKLILETNKQIYEEDLEKARNEFHDHSQEYEERIQQLKIECNTRKMLNVELEATKMEMEKNWQLVQSDDYKKFAFLGAMGNMQFMEK